MRLKQLEMRNFRQHKNSQIEFRDGLTAVIGPNGAGKTTILEAVAWALYGTPALRGKNDTVRCYAATGADPVVVRLGFSLGGQSYTVERRIRSDAQQATLYMGDRDTAIHAGPRAVDAAVRRLLRMDYREFFSSFFTGQKDLAFLAELDTAKRAATISHMLGFERLTRAYTRAVERRRDLDATLRGLAEGLGDPEELKARVSGAQQALSAAQDARAAAEARLKAADARLQALQPTKQTSEARAELHRTLTEELRNLQTELAALRDAESRLQKEADELAAAAKRLTELLPAAEEFENLRQERDKLIELQKHEAERAGLAASIGELRSSVERLDRRIGELSDAGEAEAAARQKLEDLQREQQTLQDLLQKERDKWMARQHTLRARLEQLRAQAKDVASRRAALEAAGPEGKCPTCERPFTGELPSVLAALDAEAAQLDRQVKQTIAESAALEAEPQLVARLRARQTALLSEVQAAQADLQACAGTIRELAACRADRDAKAGRMAHLEEKIRTIPAGFQREKLDHVLARGRELKPEADEAVRLQTRLERRPQVERDLDEKRREAAQRAAREAELTERLAALAFDPTAHQRIVDEYAQAELELQQAKLDAAVKATEEKAARERLEQARADERAYAERAEELRRHREERLHVHITAECLGELRSRLSNAIRPELAEIASLLIEDVTDGRYSELEIGDDYLPRLKDDEEYRPVISGGEEDVLNLCVRLAISKMIAERAGQPLSLLVLDEVFGSLDASRRDNVVQLLHGLKSRFEQIILITHVDAIHDAVDNCLWVRYDEKRRVSTVSEGLPDELEDLAA